MPAMTVRCPACARSYRVDSRLLGRHGRCKQCGLTFRLSDDGSPGPPSGAAGGSGLNRRGPVSLAPATPTGSGVRPPGSTDGLPERFGRYRILRKLGEGGMGAVYLAHDEQLDRRVALKVPHFTPRDGPEVLDRFDREARAAATLDHPNLCPVYDVGQVDGVPYLTMPYIEGKPLSEAIDPDNPIPPSQAAAVVRTLALAIQEAHARGVVHRDLKPANIMVNRRGEPVIMDFGLARRVDRGDPRLTRSGVLLGTPHYMAPEQVTDDPGAIGPACDIYSLGVILYELLAGRRPFDGPASLVLAQVLVTEPPHPSEHRPDLDPALEAICLKAMAKRPGDRYTTMAEFAAALGSYVGGTEAPGPSSPVVARLDGTDSPVTLRARGLDGSAGAVDFFVQLSPEVDSLSRRLLEPTSARRRRLIPIGTIGAVAILLGVMIWRVTARRPITPPDPPSRIGTRPARAQVPTLPQILTNSVGMRFVLIPSGVCLVGSPGSDKDANPNERPQHRIRITRPFYMGVHEVTVGQFRRFVEATGYRTDAEAGGLEAFGYKPGVFTTDRRFNWRDPGFDQLDDHPVVDVSWDGAVAFCRWLSDKENKPYRLPTEAEWELACRAGTTTRFPNGDAADGLRGIANVADASLHERLPNIPTVSWSDGFPFTAPVGRFQPNAFGLYDMLGNVWEWCSDRYSPHYYDVSPLEDPTGPDQGDLRVARGGSFAAPDDEGVYRRAYVGSAGRRGIDSKRFLLATIGFRVATSPSSSSGSPPPLATPAPEPPQEARTVGNASGRGVDLLSLADPERGNVRGTWVRLAGTLVSSEGIHSQVQIPYQPPEEYRVEVVAERKSGGNQLALGLVVHGTPVIAHIDGYEGTRSGLERLDGRAYGENGSTRAGDRLLPTDRPRTIVCTVRRAGPRYEPGEYRVTVTCEGQTIIDWTGQPDRLSLDPAWDVPDRRRLSLSSWWSVFRITKLVATPIAPDPGETPAVAGGDPTASPGRAKVADEVGNRPPGTPPVPSVDPDAASPARPRRPMTASRDAPEIREAIQGGVRYLIGRQRADGSWPDAVADCPTGTTSLVALALLAAREAPDSPAVSRALFFLQRFSAKDLGRTYSVALQARVFAATDPTRFQSRLVDDVTWLERAQIKPKERHPWPGSWTYTAARDKQGDNSNTHYALLALDAASESGIPVKPEVWTLAQKYWEFSQMHDGSWNYFPSTPKQVGGTSTLSMTCAGISGLALADRWRNNVGLEVLQPDGTIRNCGKGNVSPHLQRGIDALARHFRSDANFGSENWKYYYLAGLERAGRKAGQTYFGAHDWYAEGAAHLLHTPERNQAEGSWTGGGKVENDPVVATSFALLFLAQGGAPVLMTKLRHGPGPDWRNDPSDVANLVDVVSRDRRRPLLWSMAEPSFTPVEELRRSPILFVNGHQSPEFDAAAKANLRAYAEGGGFLLAEACCGKAEFDRGFRDLMKELFPDPTSELHPLPADHPIWTARHTLSAGDHPLWGIDHGGRTAVVYSPSDLSCFWGHAKIKPGDDRVIRALRVGQNVVDYAVDLD